jgi:hypothetical protein
VRQSPHQARQPMLRKRVLQEYKKFFQKGHIG